MAWVTEVEMSDEQEQALYPLIPVLEDYYDSSDSEHWLLFQSDLQC